MEVKLHFDPPALHIGAAMTLGSLALALAATALNAWNRRRAAKRVKVA